MLKSHTTPNIKMLVFQGHLKSGLCGKELTVPNDEISDVTKYREFANDKIRITQML